MNLKRAIILNAVLIGTIGLVAAIPREQDLKPAAVVMTLPPEPVGFSSVAEIPSEEETNWLAADTEFEKRRYWRGEQPGVGSVAALNDLQASIVLSGQDLNDSIHRPERCMTAQGYTSLRPQKVMLDLGDGSEIEVTRIRSRKLMGQVNGENIETENFAYYWFVGHESVTGDHYSRTFTDMKDRLLGGYNQRWAYFLVSSNVTTGVPGIRPRDAAATMAETELLVKEIYKRCVKRELVE